MIRRYLLPLTWFILFNSLPFFCFSQENSSTIINKNLPLNKNSDLLYENHLGKIGNNEHTSIKPFLNSSSLNSIHDSIKYSSRRNTSSYNKQSNKFIRVDGIINTGLGYEKGLATPYFFNMESGGAIFGSYKKKLTWSGLFFAGNSALPSYIDSFIVNTKVIPEVGRAYKSKQGYSYQYFAGYISYSPNKVFNFQFGHDKHFWGDGYRSLLLSDVSAPFAFVKISTTIWKLKYVNLFGLLKDITDPSGLKRNFLNKYGTFHYLSWNATKRINISLFESIIWQGTDKTNQRERYFDVNYLNPVIFFRPIEYSLGSSDNEVLGLNLKIKLSSSAQVYGQLVMDEFLLREIVAGNGWWGNKQGIQLGIKYFDLLKVNHLNFQTEVNIVKPYTYSHGSVQQNYAHYNQALAHPLGANFIESVSFLNYSYKRWFINTEFLYAIIGKDKNGKDYGSNIFEPYTFRPSEYGNKLLQGLKTTLVFSSINVSYNLFPDYNIAVEGGLTLRHERNSVYSQLSNYFYLGVKTNLINRYRDF